MNKRMICLLLCLCLVLTIAPVYAAVTATEAQTIRIPVSYPLQDAYGVDLQLLFDDKFVESVSLAELSVALSGAYQETKFENNRLNVAIASGTAITTNEPLFYLNVTLKEDPGKNNEIFKFLKVQVNEKNQDVDKSLVLLRGFVDGGSYNTPVKPAFSQGTATLNGEDFIPGTELTEEGEYKFSITDEAGNVRNVAFRIDKTAPIITIADYDKEPTADPVTVYASVNEGKLEQEHHVFIENGSFTFVATDDAGNTSSLEVTVDNIYSYFKMVLNGVPEDVKALEGKMPMTKGWYLSVSYSNGMTRDIPVTEDMLSSTFTAPGMAQGIVTYRGRIATFDYEIVSKDLASLVVAKGPDKDRYKPGQEFDPAGMDIRLVLENVYDGSVPASECTFSPIDYSTIGPQEIRVTYGQYSTVFTITVRPPVPDKIESQLYMIHGGYLLGLKAGTTVSELLSTMELPEYLKVFDGDREVSGETALATGMVLKLMDEETVKQALVIAVTGDVNGDGLFDEMDIVQIRACILGLGSLEGAQLQAADRNGDGYVRAYDYVQLMRLFTNPEE